MPRIRLMLAKAVRKYASFLSDAKVHLHLLLYPSVEEFGHEKINSAETLSTRAGRYLSFLIARWLLSYA
jgi:hypothetical protein